jgi:transposase
VSTRRAYPPEFRRQALELYRSSEKSVEQVCAELGISPSAFNRWKARAEASGEEAELSTSERAEIRRLRRENRVLREEREILKKAAAFFVKESERR